MARGNPRKGEKTRSFDDANTNVGKSSQVGLCEDIMDGAGAEDAGAVVFLFPPKGELGWSLARAFLKCKVWLLDLLSPVHDEECKLEVITFRKIFDEPNLMIQYSGSIS